MRPFRDVGEREHVLQRRVRLIARKIDRHERFPIDPVDQFAPPKIRQRLRMRIGREPERHAVADATTIEPQHQPGIARRAAIMDGVDAETRGESRATLRAALRRTRSRDST